MFKLIFSSENLEAVQKLPQEYENQLLISRKGESDPPSLSLTEIQYSPEEKTVVLISAIGNPVPLFWGWFGESLIISDSPASILDDLKGNAAIDISDLDKVGYIESLLFDGPLNERTYFLAVKKVQSAEIVTIDLCRKSVVKEWRWLPKIQTDSSIREEEAHEQAIYHVKNLLGDLHIPNEGILLPITGGLDSRLLASLVRARSSAPIHSYTFQRGWSFESWCAKRVAITLNTQHKIFNLDQDCYRDFARRSAKLSGGFVSGMHTHGIYCCEELLPVELRSLPRMFGFFGDPVTGAMTECIEEGIKFATPASLLGRYRNCLYPDLVEQFETEILSDLDDTYDAFNESRSPEHCFHEFWKIQQRQNNLITHLFSYHRCHHSVKVIEPFVNAEFIDFFLSLPLNLRFNRNLFKRVTKGLFPEVFSLPSTHYQSNSIYSKLESICEMFESMFNKINMKQELFLSPFRYEQHEKNLQNYLSHGVHNGMLLMSEAFGVKPVDVTYPFWKQGSSAKEHYRLAMLNHLFGY